MSKKALKKKILDIEGFSDIMADKIVEALPYAERFLKSMEKYSTIKTQARVSDSLIGKKYVMTGFRDKKLEEDIAERGGKVTGSVSKNTTALIVAQKGVKPTGKLKKAMDLHVPIYEKTEFITKFIR